ncbi:MAG: asparagine synthase-related protein [Thermoplasmatales archaeon]|nr:asparagine synthase-related protein [Thermoplasmatales archaeon]
MEYVDEIKKGLITAVSKLTEDVKRVAVPFSGGLDSSIVAELARRNTDVTLYVAGFESSHDIRIAHESASLLNLPLIEIMIEENDVENAIPVLKKIIKSNNPVVLSFELPLFFTAKNSIESVLFSGQGADELFAGYAKYMKSKNLEKDLENDVNELKNRGILRDKNIVSYFGKGLRTPFLDENVVRIVLSIPGEYKIKDGIRKYILREVGKSLGLPEEIVMRKKKAAQYSSGIMRAMRKLAKNKGQKLGDYIKDVCME